MTDILSPTKQFTAVPNDLHPQADYFLKVGHTAFHSANRVVRVVNTPSQKPNKLSTVTFRKNWMYSE